MNYLFYEPETGAVAEGHALLSHPTDAPHPWLPVDHSPTLQTTAFMQVSGTTYLTRLVTCLNRFPVSGKLKPQQRVDNRAGTNTGPVVVNSAFGTADKTPGFKTVQLVVQFHTELIRLPAIQVFGSLADRWGDGRRSANGWSFLGCFHSW